MVHRGFNPRARTGRDPDRARYFAGASVSIHAPARGATDRRGAICVMARFNPRARTGRDVRGRHRERELLVSIHAPARGATRPGDHVSFELHVSIHAPARGATKWGLKCLKTFGCFNPRARTGRDSLLDCN